MSSVPKILVFITAITTISGTALDIGIDTDRLKAMVSCHKELIDTLSRLKLIAPDYDRLEFMWPLRTNIDEILPSPMAFTTNTNSNISQQGNRRERRQALVKTRRTVDGPGSQSLYKTKYPTNVARFPNGDVVNHSTINMEVMNWIRQQLKLKMKTRIQEFQINHAITTPALNIDRIEAH